MIILRCTESLPGVGAGYTCLVGVRTLRHIDSKAKLAAIQAVGVPVTSLNKVGFYNAINALSLPRASVTVGADYSRR